MNERLSRLIRVAFVLLPILMLLALSGFEFLVRVPLELAFGWIPFLRDAAGRIAFNPSAMLTFALCLGGFAYGAHRLARWLYGAATEARGARMAWPVRWTAAVVALVILLFSAGIACIGVFHQSAWLARSKESLVVNRSDRIRFSMEAKALMRAAEQGDWSTERVRAAARSWVGDLDGRYQMLVATDRHGEWNGLVTVLREPAEGSDPGQVAAVLPRNGSERGVPGPQAGLEAILAHFARAREPAPAP
ncbi:MAG: hypothetical protein M5U26_09315 [Planctomycetota bacterium]|nr:hypothetical protein [Planctomycetota bacterium]